MVYFADILTRKNDKCQSKAIFPGMSLTQVSTHCIKVNINDVLLFCTIRNEKDRLLFFISYYKNLGINQFFIIDNNSTDHPEEILIKFPNLHLFHSNMSFEYTQTKYLKKIVGKFGKNHWCLIVDADEFFKFAFANILSIQDLCHFLELKKTFCFKTLLLDMYSNKKLSCIHYCSGQNPWSICPYYDHSGYETFGGYVYGGVRARVFGLKKVLLTKYPLFKLTSSVHPEIWGVHKKPISKTTGVNGILFHFKFFQSFIFRASEEAKREQHWKKAYEYKYYISKNLPNLNLFSSNFSTKYKNFCQLLFLGIKVVDYDYIWFTIKIILKKLTKAL